MRIYTYVYLYMSELLIRLYVPNSPPFVRDKPCHTHRKSVDVGYAQKTEVNKNNKNIPLSTSSGS